jgi:hypothetical protein
VATKDVAVAWVVEREPIEPEQRSEQQQQRSEAGQARQITIAAALRIDVGRDGWESDEQRQQHTLHHTFAERKMDTLRLAALHSHAPIFSAQSRAQQPVWWRVDGLDADARR